MIDIEDEVFTRVKQAVNAKYPKVEFSSTYLSEEPTTPHICLYVISNTPYDRGETLSVGNTENYSVTRFEVRFYVKATSSAKSEMKKYIKLVDETLQAMNFRRTVYPFVQQISTGLFQGLANYEVIADNKHFYKR